MKTHVSPLMSFSIIPILLSIGCAPISLSPQLRIETGMHTAAVTSVDIDNNEQHFVTSSLDKTVRVWSLETGLLLKTLRMPVGDNHDGKVYTCAISPDGKLIAAGGYTGSQPAGMSVYIFDKASGKIISRISGIPDVINHLTFSKSGRYLAATLGGSKGIRVWEAETWDLYFQDSTYGASSHWADFDPHGRMVTTSYDGLIRLYNSNFELVTSIKPPGGKRPFCAVFSPDGQKIAVGYNDTINVNILSGRDLLHLYSPDTNGILKGRPFVPKTSNTMDGNLGTVCWSKDGTVLYSGGIYDENGIVPINSWHDAGRGHYIQIDVGATNSIVGLKSISAGLLYSVFDSSFGIFNSSNQFTIQRKAVSIDPRRNLENFLISNDGSTMQIALGLGNNIPVQFSLRKHQLKLIDDLTSNVELAPPRILSSKFGVSNWEANPTPRRNGVFIPLENDEVSQSLAIHPQDTGFTLGTSKYIRCYDAHAQLRWKKKTSTGWAVNISGNGKYVIAALGDGTIRWYRWIDGAELTSLFISRDDLRWVMWTPDGFFDHSPGGESMIGFQINRGRTFTPEFVSIDQMYEQFYRPDIIFSRFFGTTVSHAQQAEIGSVLNSGLPPAVYVNASTNETEQDIVSIDVKIIDGGGGIGQVTYRVNGAVQAWDKAPPKSAAVSTLITEYRKNLTLASGDNLIQITAFNSKNTIESKPATMKVFRTTTSSSKPDLYIIAVGIGQYRDHTLKLLYPATDAMGLVGAITNRGKALFGHIKVEYVLDQNATKENIRNAFEKITGSVRPDDVFILYMAGHGLNVEGNYFFFPWELIYTGDDSVRREALSRKELQQLLARVKAKKAVVLLDTCNAGAFSDSNFRGITEKTAIYKLVRSTGRATIMASSDNQVALEGYNGHGVFTWALIAGIYGAADNQGDKNRETTVKEIADFVMGEVPRITLEKWQYEQFPMHHLLGNSFPVGLIQ